MSKASIFVVLRYPFSVDRCPLSDAKGISSQKLKDRCQESDVRVKDTEVGNQKSEIRIINYNRNNRLAVNLSITWLTVKSSESTSSFLSVWV